MKKEERTIKFPRDFFTKSRPHLTKKEPLEDQIPFEWPKEVMDKKKIATLYSVKDTN